MKTRLVHIGNSRGVRLAKPLLEEAGLTDEVEIHARAGAVVITPLRSVRAGWADAAVQAAQTEPGLLDEPTATRFDAAWEWR